MRDWALIYGMKVKSSERFTDADGAMQEHRHVIMGYAFLIDGEAVSWSSKKQEIVTLSTAESEYVAATYATQFLGPAFSMKRNILALVHDWQVLMVR